MFFVNGYLYFVGVDGGLPIVNTRAQERSLPQMDEVTSARIEELKTKSCAVEEKLRHAEEKKKKKKPQKKRQKGEQQGKLKRAASSFPVPEQEDGEQLRALRCRQGDAAFSAGDWSR